MMPNVEKILSICQDIIFLKSKGRRTIPKHVVLGLTIQHLTGSAKLNDIVSGLRHCKAVTDCDNDIARPREEQDSVIAHGFTKSFATCVFNNNDINEETMSGTTHCTTGIVVQRMSDCEVVNTECQPVTR